MWKRREYDPVTVWFVEVVHSGFFNDWPLEYGYDWVLISAKGYPSRFKPAMFRTKEDAEKFLEINRSIIEGRCVNKIGYIGLKVSPENVRAEIVFDEPISIKRLGKRGRGRKFSIGES